jgi:hypothetical protein
MKEKERERERMLERRKKKYLLSHIPRIEAMRVEKTENRQ